ncbi:MAG TPA: hypothetical protein VFQ80_18675 [Thermomicrobiales bacterium]|nr:hypothetical protein [Thermomicrobiales bacterium]
MARSLDADGRYWSALEAPFADFLVHLPDDREIEVDGASFYGSRVLPRWQATVEQAARRAFSELAGNLDRSARTLKAVAAGQREFERNLRRVAARR